MPWGHVISPAPKLATTLPSGSSLTIGSTSDSAHELVPQRSPAQMCTPSTSTLTALTDPQVRPSGSVPQSRMVAKGLGRSLTASTAACAGGLVAPGRAGAASGAVVAVAGGAAVSSGGRRVAAGDRHQRQQGTGKDVCTSLDHQLPRVSSMRKQDRRSWRHCQVGDCHGAHVRAREGAERGVGPPRATEPGSGAEPRFNLPPGGRRRRGCCLRSDAAQVSSGG